mgnify:CR=1 FL=1
MQILNELMDQQMEDGVRAKLVTSPYIKEDVLERYDYDTNKMVVIDSPLKHKFQGWKQN